ncbi:bestrophin-like domain [Longispora fulva]|uniref:DUF4239 domain-containing protein n=1 Tax=Longispora fulva TaxID=619741 RepID=A0A8J7KPY0_9ACTN|nr:DUF4239 domain-containing protein [Longispora fulva]MBG6141816.1 hypothetical protein [Longispora fulva]
MPTAPWSWVVPSGSIVTRCAPSPKGAPCQRIASACNRGPSTARALSWYPVRVTRPSGQVSHESVYGVAAYTTWPHGNPAGGAATGTLPTTNMAENKTLNMISGVYYLKMLKVNIYLEGLLWVVGAGVLAGALVYLQHRYLSAELRAQHNDVTGAFFEIIGVLYAVMLAFIVIAVWDTMNEAEDNSYKEANALVEVYWVGHNAPEPQRATIEALSRLYANTVVDKEWPQMAARDEISPEGYAILDDLRVQVESLKSTDPVTTKRYQDTADKLREVVGARGARLSAVDGGVNPVLWFALIAGAVLFVAFAYLFGVPGRLAHATMVVTVTMMVVMLLYAVYELEFPFSRGTAVGPDAMRFALERFVQIGGGGSVPPSR